jgi:protein RecA
MAGSKKKKSKKTEKAVLLQMRKSLGLKEDDEALLLASQFESVRGVIRTGHENLDRMLTPVYYEANGVGGIPEGYLCEFYGPNQGGKSSLCLKLSASITDNDEWVMWIDAEGSFQNEFALIHGVNLNRVLLLSKPGTTAETYLKRGLAAAEGGLVKMVVFDSLAALQPEKVLKQPLDKDARIGEMARLMSRACPQFVDASKKGNCSVVFINQIRMKIGSFGNPETTPGGESLRFFSSLRLRVDRLGSKTRSIMKGDEEIGIRSKVFLTKSRFGQPYKDTVVPIYFGSEQPDPLDALLNEALIAKVIKSRSSKKEGIKITFEPHFKGKPIDDLKQLMNPEIIRAIAEALSDIVVLDPEIKKFVDEVDTYYGDPLDGIEE